MMNRIKKALIVTLASISIIGNVTSAPAQAITFPDVAKNALQIAIAMSSYEHQVIWLMNNWAESTRKHIER